MTNQLQNQIANNQSLFDRAKSMSEGKTTSELEQIARNICAEKGIDYDEAMKQFNKVWRG